MSTIEQRLKNLEIEHEQQQTILETDLSNFREDISKLEKTLETMDSYIMARAKNTYERKVLSETERIEKELEEMEGEEKEQISQSSQVKKTTKIPSPPPSEHKTPTYVICLLLNPKSPQEWSGKNWCEMGNGMRYDQLDQAKQIAQKLKKQRPTYPLKIIKR